MILIFQELSLDLNFFGHKDTVLCGAVACSKEGKKCLQSRLPVSALPECSAVETDKFVPLDINVILDSNY